ncbi:GNAT family N-acetyltransferase [Intestinibacter sp.]|uniref:GNAT family N-acetyltransferase n=1 Tax=Intestinibacter sp. TaxID=1965304 RepID=UPI003F18EAE4
MEKLILVKPTVDIKQKALDYRNEFFEIGENVINGSALLDELEYEEWLKLTEQNSSKNTVRSDWVEASTFFVVRESDNKIVGMVDIRHRLNKFLASYGGHIGYSVRPSERKKGYGTQILKMAVEYAKSINIDHVMLACYKENEASRKIILKCGGDLEKEFIHTDGKVVQVYWIDN